MHKLNRSSETRKCKPQAIIPSVASLEAGDYRFIKSKAFHNVSVEDRPASILLCIGNYSYCFERTTGELSLMFRGVERVNPLIEEYKDILEISVEIFNTWTPFKRG